MTCQYIPLNVALWTFKIYLYKVLVQVRGVVMDTYPPQLTSCITGSVQQTKTQNKSGLYLLVEM